MLYPYRLLPATILARLLVPQPKSASFERSQLRIKSAWQAGIQLVRATQADTIAAVVQLP